MIDKAVRIENQAADVQKDLEQVNARIKGEKATKQQLEATMAKTNATVMQSAECQLWAVWALANLTTVSPDKYCQLVEEEGGLALVEEIVNNNSGEEESEPNQEQVKSLALKVRNNVVGWKETETTGLQFDG